MKKSKLLSHILLSIFVIYLVLPLAVTLIYSVFTDWSTNLVPTGFTMDNYVSVLSDDSFLKSMGRTVVISILPIVITLFMLLLVMYVVIVYVPWLERYIQILCMIPYAIQGVILSISIISLYTGTGTFLSNRLVMLIGAYCILILPYIYQGVRNNLYGINAGMLLEAAEMLGASRFYSFFRVIVPNIMPGVTISALLSVSIIFGDFVLANNIAGNSFQNIQVYLQQAMKTSSGRSSAVVVLIFIVVFSLTGLVLFLQSDKRKPKHK